MTANLVCYGAGSLPRKWRKFTGAVDELLDFLGHAQVPLWSSYVHGALPALPSVTKVTSHHQNDSVAGSMFASRQHKVGTVPTALALPS